jgi:ComF family protein
LTLLSDFIHLFYPNLCVGCQLEAVAQHELFCIACETKLPITDFHKVSDNEAMQRMEGGYPFSLGLSMFRFYPGGIVQEMIHQIKYKGQTNIAYRLGRRYGDILRRDCMETKDLSYIVPVPLHKKRMRARGYNQSKYFADGLSTSLGVATAPNLIIRVKDTSSQTTKSRKERLQSMEGAFKLNSTRDLKGHHLLLVDDVLTTGSTLEAVTQTLVKVSPIKVSFATIALAQ